VQTPVIDKYCIGCHNGKPRKDGKSLPDLTLKPKEARGFKIMLGRNRKCNFTPSYWTLRSYVRSTNEADIHMLLPYEFSADSAKLIRMLRKGHHNVKLPPEAWDRLITWIDLSAPYYGTWSENVGKAKVDRTRTTRKDLLKLYANIDDNPEEIFNLTTPPTAPVMPAPEKPRLDKAPKIAGWPFDAAEAKKRQAASGAKTQQTIELADGVKLVMTLIPAGEFVMGDAAGHRDETPAAVKIAKPFWMGTLEVTNAQFALFDPTHDSRIEAYPGNNFSVKVRGELVNAPDQPVCRISQTQAVAFCKWLSKKTGKKFALPTEAQWEYACRAGTASAMNFGAPGDDHSGQANLADMTCAKVWHWVHPGGSKFNDKVFASAKVGTYAPNAWGLHDMHGNVAEWTCSPYPLSTDKMAIRGGSWNDRPKNARSATRQSLRKHERAYDVGFRVIRQP
jgi:formylglycine-generating enzyme required for sulfatase activity